MAQISASVYKDGEYAAPDRTAGRLEGVDPSPLSIIIGRRGMLAACSSPLDGQQSAISNQQYAVWVCGLHFVTRLRTANKGARAVPFPVIESIIVIIIIHRQRHTS